MEYTKFENLDEELLKSKSSKIIYGRNFDKYLTIYSNHNEVSEGFATTLWVDVGKMNGYSQFCHGYGHNINQALEKTNKLEYNSSFFSKLKDIPLSSLEKLMNSNKNFGITSKKKGNNLKTSLIAYFSGNSSKDKEEIFSLVMPTFSEAFAILNSINFSEKMFKKILQKYSMDKAIEEFNKDNKRYYLRT
jgi:hypothetical protein